MFDVVIENNAIRPTTREGDQFFGLEVGANGTAAIARRRLVAPDGARWVRHNGKPAIGPLLVPTARSFLVANPWDGTL